MKPGRSGWEQSLDPGATWQHSVRGLLPGTIFAVLFVLAAVVLYFVSPLLGVIVGIVAVLNVIVALNHWIRLLSRARQRPSRYLSSGLEDFGASRKRVMALPGPATEEKKTTVQAATTFVEEQGGWLQRRLKQQIAEELPIREHGEPEYIILELPDTPSAPGIGVSRDPRSGPRPASVFFVGFNGEAKLMEVMANLSEKTSGEALLMHQLGGDGETPFLLVSPMFHRVDMEEFAQAMRAYLGDYAEDDEAVAWLEEKCELLIYDKGQTLHAVPGEGGTPGFEVISTLSEAAEASRRTQANASNLPTSDRDAAPGRSKSATLSSDAAELEHRIARLLDSDYVEPVPEGATCSCCGSTDIDTAQGRVASHWFQCRECAIDVRYFDWVAGGERVGYREITCQRHGRVGEG